MDLQQFTKEITELVEEFYGIIGEGSEAKCGTDDRFGFDCGLQRVYLKIKYGKDNKKNEAKTNGMDTDNGNT